MSHRTRINGIETDIDTSVDWNAQEDGREVEEPYSRSGHLVNSILLTFHNQGSV